ncbi:dihydrofolate reductase [Parasediminibacterium paludis]|uniref:Dihydrofolate reductase n=1 Tax=Parasediminibacterium paludis TaxID=908966 RepID=A0ABV8PUD9_9BACT
MQIIQIVAVSNNNVIGKDYGLLWTLPNDMRWFKNKTWALPVVMGRKTFKSLGNKPMNGRLNVVITRQADFKAEGVTVVANIEEAISFCKEQNYNEIMIIGGGEIYMQSLPFTDKIYLTRVDVTVDGDTYYPKLDTNQWLLAFEEKHPTDAKHTYAYNFQTWIRK